MVWGSLICQSHFDSEDLGRWSADASLAGVVGVQRSNVLLGIFAPDIGI
jgi:hypothetical protein